MRTLLRILLVTVPLSAAFAAPSAKNCGDLSTAKLGADVRIESAKMVPATTTLREHCDIRGVIWPENKVAIKLPTDWNNRFEMVGNGGWAGTISLGPMDTAVASGYASASTDTGHDAQKEPGAIFAFPSAANPNAARKVIDHGYLAVHETVLLAKKLMRAYYGSDPQYSYWVGCSTGGRQGLMEAQRYPEDFDGYVIGAPVLNLTGLQMKAIWNNIAIGPGEGEIKAAKLPALSEAIHKKCDVLDGLMDGLIENPLRCDFDAARDLTKCAPGRDDANCFTVQQIAALKKVYDGPRNSAGKLLFPGVPVGGEAFALDARSGTVKSGWDGSNTGSFALGDTFMKYMAFDPAPGATWDYHTYDFDKDPERMTATGLRINATIPDLTAVKMRGAKIVHYHGWSDPGVTAKMSVEYYEAAKKTMGAKETEDFYRFFPVPGMFHCSGGPGCGNADWLSAVANWVEKGVAPAMIVGAHIENGKTLRTRPICMWPQVAQYKGSGSIDEAGSFSCVAGPNLASGGAMITS